MDQDAQNAANAIALMRLLLDSKIADRGMNSREGLFILYRECFAVVTSQAGGKDLP